MGKSILGSDSKPEHVRWLDDYCHYCGCQLNSWDVKVSKALGYLKYHCCETCIANEYDNSVDELRDTMEGYFGMRPCKGI